MATKNRACDLGEVVRAQDCQRVLGVSARTVQRRATEEAVAVCEAQKKPGELWEALLERLGVELPCGVYMLHVSRVWKRFVVRAKAR